jgi:L-fucose mutarotase
MLKGISPLLSPHLLALLHSMGHGEEIVLADAHFPACSENDDVVRADGLRIADLLDAILPLFELDAYADDPLVMMAAVEGDQLDPAVEVSYRRAETAMPPSHRPSPVSSVLLATHARRRPVPWLPPARRPSTATSSSRRA